MPPRTSTRRSPRRDPSAPSEQPPSYGVASIVALIIFGLYVATLAPTTAMWDTSEYIAAAYMLGIPHPPGNPFFVLLGHVFSILPIAERGGAHQRAGGALQRGLRGMWFLVAERVLARGSPSGGQRITGAAAAALLGATAFTVWNQSVVNEKVYTVSLAFFAIVSWLTVLWCDDPDGRTRRPSARAHRISHRRSATRITRPAFSSRRRWRWRCSLRRPTTVLRWQLLLAGRRRARARADALSPSSRFARRTSLRSTKASRPAARRRSALVHLRRNGASAAR